MYLRLSPFWRTLLRSSHTLDFHKDSTGSNSITATKGSDNGHSNYNNNNYYDNNNDNSNDNNDINNLSCNAYNNNSNKNNELLIMNNNQLTDIKNEINLNSETDTTLSDIKKLRSELKNMSGHINMKICGGGHRTGLPVLVSQVRCYIYVVYMYIYI
jgi:hypothetical protein